MAQEKIIHMWLIWQDTPHGEIGCKTQSKNPWNCAGSLMNPALSEPSFANWKCLSWFSSCPWNSVRNWWKVDHVSLLKEQSHSRQEMLLVDKHRCAEPEMLILKSRVKLYWENPIAQNRLPWFFNYSEFRVAPIIWYFIAIYGCLEKFIGLERESTCTSHGST